MRGSSLVTTITLTCALAFGVAPAFAQRGGGGHGGGGGGHMGGGGGGGRMGGGHIGGMPSGGGMRGGGQVFGPGAGVPRGSAGVRGGTFDGMRGGTFNGARGGTFNGARGGTFNGVRGGTFNRGAWGGRSWNVAPLHFYRPYYAFHPRFNLGFGLWAGFPVSWAYPFYYPPYPYYPNYPYYPYPYPYAPAGPGYSVAPPVDETPDTPDETVGTAGVEPDQSNLGGLSFAITPSDAQVFVDGNYVGTVGQFTSTTQPLGVPAGRHHLEVRDVGYKTMSFDVDIVAGQVIPYQGQMER